MAMVSLLAVYIDILPCVLFRSRVGGPRRRRARSLTPPSLPPVPPRPQWVPHPRALRDREGRPGQPDGRSAARVGERPRLDVQEVPRDLRARGGRCVDCSPRPLLDSTLSRISSLTSRTARRELADRSRRVALPVHLRAREARLQLCDERHGRHRQASRPQGLGRGPPAGARRRHLPVPARHDDDRLQLAPPRAPHLAPRSRALVRRPARGHLGSPQPAPQGRARARHARVGRRRLPRARGQARHRAVEQGEEPQGPQGRQGQGGHGQEGLEEGAPGAQGAEPGRPRDARGRGRGQPGGARAAHDRDAQASLCALLPHRQARLPLAPPPRRPRGPRTVRPPRQHRLFPRPPRMPQGPHLPRHQDGRRRRQRRRRRRRLDQRQAQRHAREALVHRHRL